MLTSAHTAIVRRRRAMRMVAALIMGACYKAARFQRQAKTRGPPQPGGPQIRESRQITGLHGAGTSR
jgi:hypothetical protein